jgi:transcriptional regulator with XRE-family HTH domain
VGGGTQQVALRCRIVLAAASGETNLAIAAAAEVDVKTVALWRGRFAESGPEGLWEIATGRGRKPTHSLNKIKAIIRATLTSKPKGMTQWSCRQMAQAQGVSKSTISTIWRSHNLKPHRIKSFKLSRDARFLEKLTDLVGLYLNPPDQALVLCVDEKTQIQALDRTQPGHDDPRLQAQWQDVFVRGSGSIARQSGRRVFQPPPPSGVLEIPAPPRRGVSRRRGLALGDG